MIFYISAVLYWIILLIYPLSFGDEDYDVYYEYCNLAQTICLFLCILFYFSLETTRAKSTLILFAVYGVCSVIVYLIFTEIYPIPYTLWTVVFIAWAVWIMLRPEYKTAKTIDKNNILLAFYKGGNGSALMNFFELLGLPVKSMCIISGDKTLYLKKNKDRFQLKDSKNIFKREDDYVIVDTGVKCNYEFSTEMEKCATLKASKFGLRIRCIEAVNNLLGMIGEEWRPTDFFHNIPSWYFRKCSKI